MLRLSATLALLTTVTLGAQEPPKPKAGETQIRWFGHSMFMLITKEGTRVAFDAHAIREYDTPPLSPDVACFSHNHDDHNRREVFANADSRDLKVYQGVVLKGKKEDWNKVDEKFKDVRIRTVPTFHDDEEGAKRGKNTVFVVEADGLVFCHLGDLGHELTEEQVRAIGPVDVLMIPVGGIYTINGEVAKRVVAQLKPKWYVLPMHYGTKSYLDLPPADEFLDDQKNVRRLEDTNLLTLTPESKPTKPTILVLGWK